MTARIGSVFSGYGGLDLAVESVTGGRTVWHSEIDDAASRVLAHRWPGVPNMGDITTVDWTSVEPVDVLCGGSPCQDVSAAGKRAGMRAGTRSGLWASMCDAIDALRPSLVVWENVRGVTSACADSEMGLCPRCVDPDSGVRHAPYLRALGRVVGDLSDLGVRVAMGWSTSFRCRGAAWPVQDLRCCPPRKRTRLPTMEHSTRRSDARVGIR